MNFGLRVVGRRADGYHLLESVFLPVDLADDLELEVERAATTRVALALEGGGGPAAVPEGPDNLAARAAHAFLEAAGLSRAVRIRLRKRIPAAAGLGGGSSDAGAVLRGLAELFPQALAPQALARLAASLGADVPFFLQAEPRLVSGIGEVLEPLPRPWPSLRLVLANPREEVATAAVFRRHAALTPAPAASNLRSLLETADPDPSDPASLQALLVNDLEPAAVDLCPAIDGLLAALRRAGAGAVAMSGSGATVFGVFGEEAAADAAAAGIEAAGSWARVANTRESQ